AAVLPRIPLAQALDLAPEILPDGCRPMETPLRRHPRGALTRRLLWAVYGPALAAVVWWVLGRTGALPGEWWWLPLALLPLTLILAVAAYRALGHALSGPYLVVRRGGLNRHTVALQRRAVIGWTLQQSLLQRLGGRMTLGVATAAGERHYLAPDMAEGQAFAFISGATPELAEQFLVPLAGREPVAAGATGSPPTRGG
ncbi:MAG: PH domain-containing protein, partial [Actinoplanes sp.]